ncbi:MAG: phosphate ABC transporter substrate-binding protein [Myxococcaceae bacterium]
MNPFSPLALALTLLASPAAAATVTIKGSDSVAPLARRWAEEFMKHNPGARIEVSASDSGRGIEALIEGSADIAASSRPMTDEESDRLRARTQSPGYGVAVARDGLAFYVHQQNPLTALTAAQLRALFVGDLTRWNQVGGSDAPVVLYSRKATSGTLEYLRTNLLRGDPPAARTKTVADTAAMVKAVSGQPNALGYGPIAFAREVKALKLRLGGDEVAPTPENVQAGRYPLSRDLYFYLRAEPEREAKAFVEYCLSSAGQQAVSQVGYGSMDLAARLAPSPFRKVIMRPGGAR